MIIKIELSCELENIDGTPYGRMATIRAETTDKACEALRDTLEKWEALEDEHTRLVAMTKERLTKLDYKSMNTNIPITLKRIKLTPR